MIDIWVISRDHGPEGLSEPLAAFKTEADATRQKDLIEGVGDVTVKVSKVPLFSFTLADKIEP